jgi:beta-lactam-binding protein with PASTA domain
MSLGRFIISKVFFKNVLYALILVGVIVGGLWIYLRSFTDYGEFVDIPDLQGMHLADAGELLDSRSMKWMVIDSVWDDKATAGTILEQNPAAGFQAKANRTIYLTTFQQEPPLVELNVEEGMGSRVAIVRVANKGLEYEVEYEANELLIDKVVRVTYKGKAIVEGQKLKKGEKIKLIIGKGSNLKVPVPSLYGMSLDSAKKVLIESSLNIGYPMFHESIVTSEDSSVARIYMQRPKNSREVLVKSGSYVDVWLTLENLDPQTEPTDSTAIERPE